MGTIAHIIRISQWIYIYSIWSWIVSWMAYILVNGKEAIKLIFPHVLFHKLKFITFWNGSVLRFLFYFPACYNIISRLCLNFNYASRPTDYIHKYQNYTEVNDD